MSEGNEKRGMRNEESFLRSKKPCNRFRNLMAVELKVRLNKELYKQSRMNFYERAVVTYS